MAPEFHVLVGTGRQARPNADLQGSKFTGLATINLLLIAYISLLLPALRGWVLKMLVTGYRQLVVELTASAFRWFCVTLYFFDVSYPASCLGYNRSCSGFILPSSFALNVMFSIISDFRFFLSLVPLHYNLILQNFYCGLIVFKHEAITLGPFITIFMAPHDSNMFNDLTSVSVEVLITLSFLALRSMSVIVVKKRLN